MEDHITSFDQVSLSQTTSADIFIFCHFLNILQSLLSQTSLGIVTKLGLKESVESEANYPRCQYYQYMAVTQIHFCGRGQFQ